MIKVPGFTVSHLLGRGTYGLVYMGKKFGSCKLVAIKCMMKSRLGKQAQDNLVSEISILKTLEHPHIVCMLDFTWDASYVYIIMEFCGGGDLGRFLKQKRKLDELLVQHFLQQLALALQYLKSKNIIHMDLKPHNILLTSFNNPTLKLADFGFAKCIEGTAHMNEVRGTLLYMAPEIYCEGVYHPSCDLWSVGIILYECLFGAPPYGNANVQQLKELLVKDDPIEVPQTNEISKQCAALIRDLLKRKPSERLTHEQFFSHPFIDLDHIPSAQSIDKANEYLERAPKLESLGKLCEAYDCYLEGLNHLVAACNYEQSRFRKAEIRNLMKNYLIKAESLKSELCLITEMNKVSPSSTSKSHRINGNNSKDNLPDPITPVKCYRVCQQQQQQLQQPKKTSSPDLKTDIKRKSPAELKAISPSSMYYPTASQTNEINYYLREQLTINSISEINDCLSSDKASVITRVKQWFTRQNYKDEKVYESERNKGHVPTGVLVDVNPVKSAQLSSAPVNSHSLHQSSVSPPLNQNSSSSGSDTLVDRQTNESLANSQSDNSLTNAALPCVNSIPADVAKCENSQSSDSGVKVNSVKIEDDLIQIFGRNQLLELADNCNKDVIKFLNRFYRLISERRHKEALHYFENDFATCLKAVKSESNPKNRSILYEELKFSMDEAEKIKVNLDSAAETEGFQVGEEVLDDDQEQDHCSFM
uniref:Serine/threonine-protein kinase ULK3 n=2 Tax=Trichobilharzia regenti TaxID=157069 RepID=A0AA85IRR1_TRIRE|nr:unnamed protein product [Trichobilharzia regenti]